VGLDFTDVEDEVTLREIHDYVFKKYNFFNRVIWARKLHHSHCSVIDNDYGHEKYIDKLQNECHVMVK
jgi:response regulator of citrate/malate metabolism